MKREPLLHFAIAAGALLCSGYAVYQQSTRAEWEPMQPIAPLPAPPSVVDARGVAVPSGDYRRIVICGGGAVVQRLAAFERIAAIDAATADDPATAWSRRTPARAGFARPFRDARAAP